MERKKRADRHLVKLAARKADAGMGFELDGQHYRFDPAQEMRREIHQQLAGRAPA